VRNRNPDRYRAGVDERPWWEEDSGPSVFDRPTVAARPGAGREPGGWPGRDDSTRAARDLWANAQTRVDDWAPDNRTAAYRDPWPADPGPAAGAWAPADRTAPATRAYQPTRYPPPDAYPPPPAAGPATAPLPRTAVWPAPPYADQPEPSPGRDPGAGGLTRPGRDDGPGSDGRSRRRRRDRSGRGRRGFPLGVGALFGLAGMGCLVVALVVLPWFRVGGRDVGLDDMADSFTLAETDPADIVGGAGEGTPPPSDGGLPTPGDLANTAEQEARDAAGEAAANALDSTRARYLDLYTDKLWMGVIGAAAGAVLFSTLLAPRSFAMGLLLGFRTLAGLATVAAAGAHGVALWVVFSGRGAPDPAWGVWLGVGGLAGVLLGCIIGPKR
jgi:hypothetical protein